MKRVAGSYAALSTEGNRQTQPAYAICRDQEAGGSMGRFIQMISKT